MSTYQFQTRRVLVESEPTWASPDVWAFVAPRPLLGAPTSITPTGWAGEVIVRKDDPDAERFVAENHRLDAYVAVWTNTARLAEETRCYLEGAYPSDDVARLTDDEVISMAQDIGPIAITFN